MKADVEKRAEARPRPGHSAASSAAAAKLRHSYEELTRVVTRAPSPATEQDLGVEDELPEQPAPAVPHKRSIFSRWLAAAERRRMQVANRGFSSITRRIMLLNLAGLVALVAGILYLSEYRENLVDARVQSMLTQGEIIAAAIAASATADTRTSCSN